MRELYIVAKPHGYEPYGHSYISTAKDYVFTGKTYEGDTTPYFDIRESGREMEIGGKKERLYEVVIVTQNEGEADVDEFQFLTLGKRMQKIKTDLNTYELSEIIDVRTPPARQSSQHQDSSDSGDEMLMLGLGLALFI